MSENPGRPVLTALACLIAALALVACGGDSGNDDSGTTVGTGAGSTSGGATGGTSTAGAPTTSTGTTPNVSEDAITALFFDTIHKTVLKKGLSESAAQCIETKLRNSITPAELDQIKAGERPASLRAKATAAGAACGAKLGG